MNFSIIPVAEASFQTLIKSINQHIINPIIILVFALAVVYFIYGLALYFLNPDNEEIRKTSKSKMIYGIIGLFIMTAVFGIEKIILNTLEIRNIKINNAGNYEIVEPTSQATLLDRNIVSDQTPFVPSETQDSDLSDNPNLPPPAKGLTYTMNPFGQSTPNPKLCWRQTIFATGKTFYQSTESAKQKGRNTYLSFLGIDPVKMPTMANDISNGLPLVYGVKRYFDPNNKLYYTWEDIRAPIKNGKEADCSAILPNPSNQSNKVSSLSGEYMSDDLYYRVVDSGTNIDVNKARTIAITNALIQIARSRGLYKLSDIPSYFIIAEKRFELPDPMTGEFHYFVAIESKK